MKIPALLRTLPILIVFCAASAFAADPIPGAELRGIVGIVIGSPKQAPGGDFRSIIGVLPDTPAAAAGLKRGDYILSVDGKSTAFLKETPELLQMLRGDPDSTVLIELKHVDDGRVETISIKRTGKMFLQGPPATPRPGSQ